MNPIQKGKRILFYCSGKYIEGIVDDYIYDGDKIRYKVKLYDNSEMIISGEDIKI